MGAAEDLSVDLLVGLTPTATQSADTLATDAVAAFLRLVATPVLDAATARDARRLLRERLALATQLRFEILRATVAVAGLDAVRRAARDLAGAVSAPQGSVLDEAVALLARTSAVVTWKLPSMLTPPSSHVVDAIDGALHAASVVEATVWVCLLGESGQCAIRSSRVFGALCRDALAAAQKHQAAVDLLLGAVDRERRVVLLLQELREAKSVVKSDRIEDSLHELAPPFLAELGRIALETHEPPSFRASLVTVLAGVDPRGSRETLLAASADADPRVRVAALEGLSELLPDGRVEQVLREHAERDANPSIRATAAGAIATR